MKLYELTEEWLQIIEALDSEEIPPDIASRLSQIESDITRKIDGCCRMIKGYEASSTGYKAEADRLTKLANGSTSRAAWLKKYIKEEMERLEETKIETPLFNVAIQCNSSVSVSVINESAVPAEYDRPVERQIDKKAIAEAVKAGKTVPGTEVSRGTHLRIR